MARKIRIHTSPLPSPKKIAKRGLYDALFGKGKVRDYEKKMKKGKYH